MNIDEIVVDVFKEHPGERPFRSLRRWDSLNHMNLIVAIEGEYDIDLTEEEITEIVDIKSLEAVIAGKKI